MARPIEVDIAISPRLARAALSAGLLLWSATELGSETLTLSTAYPSPVGIYSRLTTTNQTILARDGGNVGIGTSAPSAKLHVAGGDVYFEGNLGIGIPAAVERLEVDGSVVVTNTVRSRLGSLAVSGGSFGVNVSMDEDANSGDFFNVIDGGATRFRVSGNSGDVRVTGTIGDTAFPGCRWVDYAVGSATTCGAPSTIVAWRFNGAAGVLIDCSAGCPSFQLPVSGSILCCRLFPQ